VLNIVTDPDGNERIVHVNKPALAGYASHSKDPEFIQELPSYSLPDIRFKSGTHRSFDVMGDSMAPTIDEGNRLICNFVEPSMWKTSIKNGEVYVVVAQDDIFVKRIDNSYRRKLKLFSDNPDYDPFQLDFNEVRELWNVKMILRNFNHYESQNHGVEEQSSVSHLQQMIQTQGEQIEQLLKQLKN
jgi:phage repressor protein C with HTH and peptisase S24 domain